MRSKTALLRLTFRKKEGEGMVIPGDLDLKQDVITIRLSHLSQSEAFRQEILDRLNADEDPFGMKEVEVGSVQIGIVSDERDDFAAKLDQLLGSGAGAAYVDEVNALDAPGVQDTTENRDHIWGYWQDQADANAALRPKKKLFDLNSLSQGSVHYIGEYTLEAGSPTDIEMSEDADGQAVMMFRNAPGVWFKLEGGG
jgi:hypothetical protein